MDDEKKTRRELAVKVIRQAELRIKRGRPSIVDKKRKLTVSSVAEEAGMSESNLRNNYPAEVDHIRGHKKKEFKQQRDLMRQKLQDAKARIRELAEEMSDLRRRLKIATSQNRTLLNENQELQTVKRSSNVRPFPTK